MHLCIDLINCENVSTPPITERLTVADTHCPTVRAEGFRLITWLVSGRHVPVPPAGNDVVEKPMHLNHYQLCVWLVDVTRESHCACLLCQLVSSPSVKHPRTSDFTLVTENDVTSHPSCSCEWSCWSSYHCVFTTEEPTRISNSTTCRGIRWHLRSSTNRRMRETVNVLSVTILHSSTACRVTSCCVRKTSR